MMAPPSRRVNAWFANALVFSNGHPCRAHREETHELLPRAQVDLVYFDPPYATEFSTTNYEKSYHFVEGLMTYWKGLEGKAKDEDEKGGGRPRSDCL